MALKNNRFIQLRRTFSDFHHSDDIERDTFADYFNEYAAGKTQWVDILRSRCVILLAEAGSGKTRELQEQARSASLPAFFMRLEDLARGPLQPSLIRGSHTPLSEWLTAHGKGLFFLDAVDEAKLTTRRALERALQTFVDGLGSKQLLRAHVVISSRLTGWRPREDLQIIKDLFDIPTNENVSDKEDNSDELILREGDNRRPAGAAPLLRVVKMDPLSREQTKALAGHYLGEHAKAFLSEISDNNAWGFARRPQDVLRLSSYWLEHRSFGSLSELIEYDIQARLRESDEDRNKDGVLPNELLRQGAELLAAAAIFGKTFSIALENEDPAIAGSVVVPSLELPSWNPEQRRELLTRALFDPAAFGLVRFHHRSAAEYLAAKWIDWAAAGSADTILS